MKFFKHPEDNDFDTAVKDTVTDLHEKFDSAARKTNPSGFMSAIGIDQQTIEDSLESKSNVLANHNFTHAELSHALHSIDIQKATGLDRITPIFVKTLSDKKPFRDFLLSLFNTVLNSGHVPKQWKLDRRILLKKKGDHTDSMNYRPLLSNLQKNPVRNGKKNAPTQVPLLS